jgi:putative selenate reductase
VAELTPAPFAHLLRRMVRELEREARCFDLPARRFWRGDPGLDTSVAFHGRRAANPAGPAAGPHGQMAQNLAIAWLAGSRILELKTIQRNDRLTIPRPCIDIASVGYNVEWSQELLLAQSRREYVAGAMLIAVLRQAGLPGVPAGSGKDDTVVDISVGYDLEGIRSPEVGAWIAGLADAGADIEALRGEIPDDLRRYRDVDFPTQISRQITLSTFHGCPAGEIEAICRFLLEEAEVDLTLKLNPTLLGREAVDGMLHDVLGYREIETRPEDFAHDLAWGPALELIDRLAERAAALGRGFAVKLTNTLVVRNHRKVFPPSQVVQYLSGQPLHVLTLALLDRLKRARPGLPLSFSAGVDARNFADCVSLGLAPVSSCTDLLRAGGVGRLSGYLENLEERMRAIGVRTIEDFVVKAQGQGEAALAAAGQGALHRRVLQEAARLNASVVAARVAADPRYRAEANRATPRKVGSHLVLFDCLNCDKCLPVCPNDANFAYEVPPARIEAPVFRVRGGQVVAETGGVFEVRKAHQIACFQDFCNACGNCDTFCPEDGGPFLAKPRLFGSLEGWTRDAEHDGLHLAAHAEGTTVWARVGGREYRLELDAARERGQFSDGVVMVEVQHAERRVIAASASGPLPEGHALDFGAYLAVATVVDGVLDPRRANPINAALP